MSTRTLCLLLAYDRLQADTGQAGQVGCQQWQGRPAGQQSAPDASCRPVQPLAKGMPAVQASRPIQGDRAHLVGNGTPQQASRPQTDPVGLEMRPTGQAGQAAGQVSRVPLLALCAGRRQGAAAGGYRRRSAVRKDLVDLNAEGWFSHLRIVNAKSEQRFGVGPEVEFVFGFCDAQPVTSCRASTSGANGTSVSTCARKLSVPHRGTSRLRGKVEADGASPRRRNSAATSDHSPSRLRTNVQPIEDDPREKRRQANLERMQRSSRPPAVGEDLGFDEQCHTIAEYLKAERYVEVGDLCSEYEFRRRVWALKLALPRKPFNISFDTYFMWAMRWVVPKVPSTHLLNSVLPTPQTVHAALKKRGGTLKGPALYVRARQRMNVLGEENPKLYTALMEFLTHPMCDFPERFGYPRGLDFAINDLKEALRKFDETEVIARLKGFQLGGGLSRLFTGSKKVAAQRGGWESKVEDKDLRRKLRREVLIRRGQMDGKPDPAMEDYFEDAMKAILKPEYR